jgi:hypothetical protein
LYKILNKFKSGINVKDLKTNLVSYKDMILFLTQNSDYKKILNNNNSIRSKLSQKGVLRDKTINSKKSALKLFHTALSVSKITKILGINEKTLKKIWLLEFGAITVNERTNRLKYLHLKLNKDYCSTFNKNKQSYDLVVSLFCSELSVNYIGDEASISPATVINIWKKVFGLDAYNKRKKHMRKIQQKKYKKCCKAGSKNEILCYNLIKNMYPYSIHHDYSIVDNLEIDISIPNKKIAINWDGKVHRCPIYGQVSLNKTLIKDNIKNDVLISKGWTNIVVIDDGSYNEEFVSKKVNEINNIIKSNRTGRIEI